jgi:hypothetical protein
LKTLPSSLHSSPWVTWIPKSRSCASSKRPLDVQVWCQFILQSSNISNILVKPYSTFSLKILEEQFIVISENLITTWLLLWIFIYNGWLVMEFVAKKPSFWRVVIFFCLQGAYLFKTMLLLLEHSCLMSWTYYVKQKHIKARHPHRGFLWQIVNILLCN